MSEKTTKSIVCGITLVLICLSVTSTIGARSIVTSIDNNGGCGNRGTERETIEIVILEHFTDGVRTELTQEMTRSDFESLKTKLSYVSSLEDGFEILRQYGILLEEHTLEDFESNIHETLRNCEVPQEYNTEMQPVNIGRSILWLQNFLCAVYMVTEGINIPIGISLITLYINEKDLSQYRLHLPSIDVIDVCFGYAFLRTLGPLGTSGFGGAKTFSGLAGFIGISLREKEPIFKTRSCIYFGFSLYAYSVIFNV